MPSKPPKKTSFLRNNDYNNYNNYYFFAIIARHKDFPKDPYKMKESDEKFLMFKCPTCKTAKDVWYDTKGDSLDEDIYHCLNCNIYFSVSAICDKCGNSHSRSYGCNNSKCDSMEYHYEHEEEEIKRVM